MAGESGAVSALPMVFKKQRLAQATGGALRFEGWVSRCKARQSLTACGS